MALIIALRNISNLADESDYEYGVYINERGIAKGKVLGHRRADGWKALLQKLVEQHKDH